MPFIIERLLLSFLRIEGKDFSIYKIPCPLRDAELNVHLVLLRQMKDLAHQTRSPFLANCWMNYRNIYVTQVFGQAWAQANLPRITPAQVSFSAAVRAPAGNAANTLVTVPGSGKPGGPNVRNLKPGALGSVPSAASIPSPA